MLDSLEFWEGDFTNYFNHTSKYRGPPTKELQEAWLGLWDCKHSSHSQSHSRYDTSAVETNMPQDPPIGVDDEIVKDLNKTEAKHVEIIGSDPNKPTYAAMVEVFHQLHCLVRPPNAKIHSLQSLLLLLTLTPKRTSSAKQPGPSTASTNLGATSSTRPTWRRPSPQGCT